MSSGSASGNDSDENGRRRPERPNADGRGNKPRSEMERADARSSADKSSFSGGYGGGSHLAIRGAQGTSRYERPRALPGDYTALGRAKSDPTYERGGEWEITHVGNVPKDHIRKRPRPRNAQSSDTDPISSPETAVAPLAHHQAEQVPLDDSDDIGSLHSPEVVPETKEKKLDLLNFSNSCQLTIFTAKLEMPVKHVANAARKARAILLAFSKMVFFNPVTPTVFVSPLSVPKSDRLDDTIPKKADRLFLSFQQLQFSYAVTPSIFAAPLGYPTTLPAAAHDEPKRDISFQQLQFSYAITPSIFAAPLAHPTAAAHDDERDTSFQLLQFSYAVSPCIFTARMTMKLIESTESLRKKAENSWHVNVKPCNPSGYSRITSMQTCEIIVPYEYMDGDSNGTMELVFTGKSSNLCEVVYGSYGDPIIATRRAI